MNNQKNNKIIKNLENTFCRLKKSDIEGVGIFAIKDIPAGTNPFLGVNKQKWHKVSDKELKNLDKEIQKMVSDFFCADKRGNFLIPECGLNGIDISFFLNTSKNPNVTTKDGIIFRTIKNIKKGQELTVSYANYDERYKK